MNWPWMLVIGYVLYAVFMVLAHPRFLYPFGPDVFDDPRFTRSVIADGPVAMALAEGSDDTAVLFFMGNGGALAYFTLGLNAHIAADRTVAAMEYPGGGGIPGRASERRLKADALTAYDWLAARHSGPIAVHGFSLGTGLALHVAAYRPVYAVVLDAPYVRLCTLMARASFLPACYMPFVQKWDSAALLSAVNAPVLIQHGSADQLIPPQQSVQLAALLRDLGKQVQHEQVAGATHNNLAGQPGYASRIDTFLDHVPK